MHWRGSKKPKNHGRLLHKQAGASLIEVMVAFLILSVGLLGLAMLQAKSLRLNTDAYMRSQATLIAHELMENMRANPTGNYAAYSGKPSGGCSSCNAVDKAVYDDVLRWWEAQENLLPSPDPTIAKSGSIYTITMKWQERDLPVTQTWVLSL